MKTKVISILTKLTMMAFFTAYLTGCDDPVEKVSSVSLDKTTLALKEGENATLKATVLPAGAGNKKITWTSSDSNIASVDQTGKVTAVKAGSAKVTVTTEDGGKTASCAVTVTAESKEDVAVTGVTIAPSEDTNLKVESTLTVTATVSPANAKDRDVTWSGYDAAANPPGSIKDSDDDAKEIASYTMENGVIKVTGVALGAGILTVTTKDGNHSDTLKITVVAKTDATVAVTGVTLDPSADFDLQKDLGVNLMATVKPDNATDKTLTWTSGDEAIVTVDNGVVTGVALGGPIEIIVTSNSDQSIADTLKVTVVASVPVTGVTVDPTEKTDLKVDETFEVMAIVKPFGSLQTVTWSGYDATATPPTGSIKASNNDAKVIATYTMGTDGKLTVTGKAVGAGILTVKTTDGGKTDNLNITVVAATPTVTISLPNGVTNTLTAVGATLQLSASAKPVVEGAKFTWSSSDITVATVDADGKVSAVSHGTAIINADYNDGNQGTIDIIVNIPAEKVSFSSGTEDINGVGVTVGFSGDVLLNFEPSGADQTVVWAEVHKFDDATKKRKIFDKNNVEIATFNYSSTTGKVTIVGSHAGTGTLVVYNAEGKKDTDAVSATLKVTVEAVAVTGVAITAIPVGDLKVNSTLAVTATVSPANATDKTVTWSDYDATANPPGRIKDSNDKVIATYTIGKDEKLTVTGVAPGSGILTVTTKDGNHSKTLDITVVEATTNGDVTGVTIYLGVFPIVNDTYYLGVRSTLVVTAEVSPDDATNKTVTGSDYDATANPPGRIKDSDDKVIATYTMVGGVITITGKEPGAGTLTVTTADGGYQAKLKITVATVTISHSNGTSSLTFPAAQANSGETLKFSASVNPGITNPTIKWSSSNTEVATVNGATGEVTAVGSGTTTITAKYRLITSNEIEVTVPTTNTITITEPASSNIATLGGLITLVATLATDDTSVTIKWSSSDENVAIVSVDGAGEVTVTAVANGTATITATAYDIMTPPAEIITIPKATIEITVGQ